MVKIVTDGFEALRDGIRGKIGYGAIGPGTGATALDDEKSDISETDPPGWTATSELIRSATAWDEYITIPKANGAGVTVGEIALTDDANTYLVARQKLSATVQKTASMAWRVSFTFTLSEG